MTNKIKTAYEIAVERTSTLPPAPSAEELKVQRDLETRTCMNCTWLREDTEGWSSWTITGYKADCMFGLNSFHSEDGNHDHKNDYAKECDHFERGSNLVIPLEEEDGEIDQCIKDWIKIVRSR